MSQNITVYVRASGTKGTLVDEYNAGSGTVPCFAVFTDTQIKLKLFKDASTAYTQAELSGYRWEFYADDDFDGETEPKIGTISGITVTDGIITIPIDTGNETLIEWLETSDEKAMKAEILGYSDATAEYADFCCQFDLKVTNRVFYTGSYTPSPIEGLYYTKAQVDAKFYTIANATVLAGRVTDLETAVNGVNSALDTLLS